MSILHEGLRFRMSKTELSIAWSTLFQLHKPSFCLTMPCLQYGMLFHQLHTSLTPFYALKGLRLLQGRNVPKPTCNVISAMSTPYLQSLKEVFAKMHSLLLLVLLRALFLCIYRLITFIIITIWLSLCMCFGRGVCLDL